MKIQQRTRDQGEEQVAAPLFRPASFSVPRRDHRMEEVSPCGLDLPGNYSAPLEDLDQLGIDLFPRILRVHVSGALEVSAGTSCRAITFRSRLFRLGHSTDRFVLLACPYGRVFHSLSKAPQLLRELRQVNAAALDLLESVALSLRAGAESLPGLPLDIVGVSLVHGRALDNHRRSDPADVEFALRNRPLQQDWEDILNHSLILGLEHQP